jgi:hypothetical protein
MSANSVPLVSLDGKGRRDLSQDEIVFAEVRYREPERVCRLDQNRRQSCLAYELRGADDPPIFLGHRPADAIKRHALRDTSVELGGILLGKECLDERTGQPFVWITESLEAKHYENTQASFTCTHHSWEEMTHQRSRLHPSLDIVGWYVIHKTSGRWHMHWNSADQLIEPWVQTLDRYFLPIFCLVYQCFCDDEDRETGSVDIVDAIKVKMTFPYEAIPGE